MKPVTAYQASNGQLFHTAEACAEYEQGLRWGVWIDKFALSNPDAIKGAARKSYARRILILWETFKAAQGIK